MAYDRNHIETYPPNDGKGGFTMKQLYIRDLLEFNANINVTLLGWIKARRHHGKVVFLDVCDSTGTIQVVVDGSKVTADIFDLTKKIPPESAVKIEGKTHQTKSNGIEIVCKSAFVIGEAKKQISPQPRTDFDIFDISLTDQLLSNRHLYIRNPKIMAILKFRHELTTIIRHWFHENRFIEITAPTLTAIPLYEDGSALSLEINGEKVFLTQCVGFYLESAVHAFERVYNMGPSFRGEESRSKRHLMEYWHIKGELAFGDLEDIIALVESLISYTVKNCEERCSGLIKTIGTKFCTDGLNAPFPRIGYREAVSRLQKIGVKFEFGKSLGSHEEALLSKQFAGPFWVTGIPRKIEPFPYVIDSADQELTRTADLIASEGFGELLGVAEKISDASMLDIRMEEKGKIDNPKYQWLREMREFGCVPHVGFGMGLERFIRWLLRIPHVRDTIPFPRIFRRTIHP